MSFFAQHAQFFIQFAVVLLCILAGAQVGGIGLGVFGGIGLAILSFGFGLEPTSPPIDVMLMIMAVVSAAAAMQAAGGLDYMIKIATRVLHKNPKYITFIAPMVTYTFTVLAGTGHVAYSVLPVIAEVSRKNGIRPERPLTMAVIASQFAIVASPIAAAVVACVSYLEPQHITMADVLKVSVPSTIIGIGIACVLVNRMGKELKDDPEYQRRLQDPAYSKLYDTETVAADAQVSGKAKISVGIFLFAAILVVLLGAMPSLRPVFNDKPMGMAHTIEIVMLSAAALIIVTCKPDGNAITQGSVFHAGTRRDCRVWRGLAGRYADARAFGRSAAGGVRPCAERTVGVCLCAVCAFCVGEQPGRHRGYAVPGGHFAGRTRADYHRHIRGGERLFLHSELRPDYCRHRFR